MMVVAWVALLIAISREIGEALELAAGERHQFGHGREIPVRVEDLGVTHVGRQRQHHLIDIGALGMPEHHAPDGKGVTQVVQARRLVCTAIDPAQAVAQTR